MNQDLKIVLSFVLAVILPPLLFWPIFFVGGNEFDLVVERYQLLLPLLVIVLLAIGMLPLVLLKLPPRQKLIWYIAYLPITGAFSVISFFLMLYAACLGAMIFGSGCDF